jgi:hypothetical protein
VQSSSRVVGSGTGDVSGPVVVKFAEYVVTIGLPLDQRASCVWYEVLNCEVKIPLNGEDNPFAALKAVPDTMNSNVDWVAVKLVKL